MATGLHGRVVLATKLKWRKIEVLFFFSLLSLLSENVLVAKNKRNGRGREGRWERDQGLSGGFKFNHSILVPLNWWEISHC